MRVSVTQMAQQATVLYLAPLLLPVEDMAAAVILVARLAGMVVLVEGGKDMALLQREALEIHPLSVHRKAQMEAQDMRQLLRHLCALAVAVAQMLLGQMQHQLLPEMVATEQPQQFPVHP